MRSRSRSTRSDLVAILRLHSLPCICSKMARVRQTVSSSGCYGSVVTEKQFFPCIPLRVFDFRPKFNVYELSPGLRVIGKTLHKRCVAIFAAVATAHIRIDRIITHRQIGFCEDAFYFNVSDDWLHCMYAPLILLIFHGTVSSYPSYRQNRLFDTAACLCLRFQDKFLKYAADEPALQAT